MHSMNTLMFVFIAYLVGSIPFGILAAKLVGAQDPRTVGSRNIGFTNVLRTCGRKAGLLTLTGDFGKGLAVAILIKDLGIREPEAILILFAVIAGHLFSLFLAFTGGKGVATGLGAILGYDILVGTIALATWACAVWIWRYSSGGAIAAFATLPIVSALMGRSVDFFIFSLLTSAAILWKHRDNIKRLLGGTEAKIGTSNISS